MLSVLSTACVGLGALAVLLSSGVLADHAPPQVLAGMALCCGALTGAALTACMTVEQVPRRQDFKHAMPRWHSASLGAWLGVAVWLGPALGSVAFTALGGFYGVLALALPLLCAGFLLLRWNEPRSPWRHRVSTHAQTPAAASVPSDTRARGVAAGIAIASGLLVAQGWMTAMTMPHGLADAVVACALGVGVFLGLLNPLRRRRHKGTVLALAALLNGLVLLVPDTVAWQASALVAAALLTAYLLGHAVASAQHTLPPSPSVMLVGAALGVSLAAGLVAAGGVVASLSFAATLALLTSWWSQTGVRRQPTRKDGDAA